MQNPDTHFIFLDLRMPGSDGFTGLSALRTEYPDVPVIMVSAEEDPVIIKQALALGAAAYIPKSAPLELLSEAINAVSNGDTWLPPELADDVKNARALIDNDFAQRLEQLTPQQFRVLKMIADGLLNKQIADKLNISEATVKAHITALFKKLNINNRSQAVIVASQLQLSA